MGRTRAGTEVGGIWEVETNTSLVLCLWDVEGAVNLTGSGLGLAWPVMEPSLYVDCQNPLLFSGAPQHFHMIEKILFVK